MKLEDTQIITARCTNGEPASCSHACPFHLDVRAFTDKCARGKWLQSYKTLRNEVVFPEIVSRLCDAPCQQHCQRSAVGDEPINLPALERATLKHTKKRPVDNFVIPPREQSVAVIGAGVAGLSLALVMSQMKYRVTVFDSAEGWGGSLRTHSDWAILEEDIRLQFSVVDVTFNFSHTVTSLSELDGYSAIYIATGKGSDDFGTLSSYDSVKMTTGDSRIYIGGEVCGETLMEGIAHGPALARTLETFLQTGAANAAPGGYGGASCENYPTKRGVHDSVRIVEGEDGYSEAEAIAEAKRCMQCDCSECMLRCEMLDMYKKKPQKIAVEIFTDSKASPPIATHINTRQTYSCTMCGECKNVCHEDIYMGELFMMSRRDRSEKGDAPLALHDYWMREMDFSVTDGSFVSAPKGKDTCEYVFFPGCQLGAYKPEHVTRTYELLSEKYNAGIFLGCCGAPAYWAGDVPRQDENIEFIRETAKRLGNPKFVFACATCETLFQEFLPEIERVSLYELLADDDSLNPTASFPEAAIFDPCASRDNPEMQSAVREIAGRSGAVISELPEKNRCCGYGGLIQVANPKLFDKMVTNRADMSDKPYVVYCANCHEVFLSRGKECIHILDMALGLPASQQVTKIADKRRNSIRTKEVLVEMLTGEKYAPEVPEWSGVKLIIEPMLFEEIDRKLISEDDIKEAIWLAEKTGDKFTNSDTGVIQCCLIRDVLTYWVQYKEAGDSYEIINAFYHRMSFIRDEQ